MRRIFLFPAALTLAATMAVSTMATAMSGAAEEPFGPACSAVPDSGTGSFSAMAEQPVATAASTTPALSTLTAAVAKAGLVDTLNSAKDITLFAPTNAAFAAIPQQTRDRVLADKEMLTKVLAYHVVKGEQTPTDLTDATLTTLEGGRLTTSGSGESYRVNDAKVVCGDVRTANATVYVIDRVLMPD